MNEHRGRKYTARVTVREWLKQHRLSAYRLAVKGWGEISRTAVHALAWGEADRVDLGTLGRLAGLLERLTDERVSVGDLLTLERTT